MESSIARSMKILKRVEIFLGYQWIEFWTKPKSVFDTLDLLTVSTWKFTTESIDSWIGSNQKGPFFVFYHSFGGSQQILRFWIISLLVFMSTRFVLYSILSFHYPSVIRPNGQLLRPGLPYYYGDISQILYAFTLHVNLNMLCVTIFCLITLQRFRLTKYSVTL